MSKVKTFLTFKENGEEAIQLYVSLIKNSKILNIVRSETDGPIAKGALLNASFVLDGQEYMAMDGGPTFNFEEGVSLFVNCENQAEVDLLWEKLSEGGQKGQCGWLKDKYGLSWQIIPNVLGDLLTDENPRKAQNVMQAMLQMTKIDIQALQRAYEQ